MCRLQQTISIVAQAAAAVVRMMSVVSAAEIHSKWQIMIWKYLEVQDTEKIIKITEAQEKFNKNQNWMRNTMIEEAIH